MKPDTLTTRRDWRTAVYRTACPAVEWLTYGSGWLSGMKLGDTPLVEYTRDRLHRETLRSFRPL
ncbi:Rhs core protein with extension [Escherichia coli]|uniref:Rhs core protein with extension n=1 Tax=Escherichia coli TaxID=562 RepID=A0A376MKD2_ECOLX|nr:Rhs core protein with extension [Escherichia coli]